jgi:hypothetical protein
MQRFLVAVAAFAVVCALVPVATAAGPAVANGGGRGADPVTGVPTSQFGFGVTKNDDGSVQGDFNCLMAGATQFDGFKLMAARGQVTSAVIDPSAGTATLSVVGGTLILGDGGPIPAGRYTSNFSVIVHEGGPGVGSLLLTVTTPIPFVLLETVLNGQISIH